MCEPRNRDNGASDVWALTAYNEHENALQIDQDTCRDEKTNLNLIHYQIKPIYQPL